ncbi:DUF397 domain-containing protein [Nocardia carnea]|uniref:DUF397 domain-containing protein n=1 Tax=Nocardia carnea TaxID=37328 RepID=UPI00245624D2|nr:DUF397 domain-containing protein [Nocardia carnea]
MTTGVWRKATRSNNSGACVEVLEGTSAVSIRDSKYLRNPLNDPAAEPIITVTKAEWSAFIDEIAERESAFKPTRLQAITASDGTVHLTYSNVILIYTPAEWDAFVAGARGGEFDFATPAAA